MRIYAILAPSENIENFVSELRDAKSGFTPIVIRGSNSNGSRVPRGYTVVSPNNFDPQKDSEYIVLKNGFDDLTLQYIITSLEESGCKHELLKFSFKDKKFIPVSE